MIIRKAASNFGRLALAFLHTVLIFNPGAAIAEDKQFSGKISSYGLAKYNVDVSKTAIVRAMAMPFRGSCEKITATVNKVGRDIEETSSFPDKDSQVNDDYEVGKFLVGPGAYRITFKSNQKCGFVSNVYKLADKLDEVRTEAKLNATDLSELGKLKNVLISSHLERYIDLGSLNILFLDRLESPEQRLAALRQACSNKNNKHGYTFSQSYLNSFTISAESLYMQAMGFQRMALFRKQANSSGMQVEEAENENVCSDLGADSMRDNKDRRIPTFLAGKQYYRIFVDLNFTRYGRGKKERSLEDTQFIISKIGSILSRRYSVGRQDILIDITEHGCDSTIENADLTASVGRSYCRTSQYTAVQLSDKPNMPSGTQSVSLRNAEWKLRKSNVEQVIKEIFHGKGTPEFLVEDENLIRVRVTGSEGLIIRNAHYWEIVNFDIVRGSSFLGVAIDPRYAPGIGSVAPPERTFKMTDYDYSSETNALLLKFATTLSKLK